MNRVLSPNELAAEERSVSLAHLPIALILGWILPGLGHVFIRHRVRGMIFFITITLTFWTGVAVGGIRSTVNPDEHKLWFAAQLGAGGHALVAWTGSTLVAKNQSDPSNGPVATAHWRSSDIALHYTGVAGLLNVIILLDALSRIDLSNGGTKTVRVGRGRST